MSEEEIMYKNREGIRRIIIAVNVIDGVFDVIAKKIGIKENALTLLYALDDGKLHSQKEICEQWYIPKTTLNTIVKEYTKAGYIYLKADNHKKEKEICLTENGQKHARKILSQVYELEQLAMKRTLDSVSDKFIGDFEEFAGNLKEEIMRFSNES